MKSGVRTNVERGDVKFVTRLMHVRPVEFSMLDLQKPNLE